MEKIKFYKNNRLVDIKGDKIAFIREKRSIIKENNETIITLDFMNETCQLYFKMENRYLNIPVLKMHSNQVNNEYLFEYTLISEPEVENMIVINKK